MIGPEKPSGAQINKKPETSLVGGSVPATGRGDVPEPRSNGQTMVMVIYILYLVGLALSIAAIGGVVLAYINRAAAEGTWLEGHIHFQIRTWWLWLLIFILGAVLVSIGVGFLIMIFFLVWAAIRSIKGLSALSRREPIVDPTLLFW